MGGRRAGVGESRGGEQQTESGLPCEGRRTGGQTSTYQRGSRSAHVKARPPKVVPPKGPLGCMGLAPSSFGGVCSARNVQRHDKSQERKRYICAVGVRASGKNSN